MKYIHGTEDFTLDKDSAVTLGKFDGVHMGHQKLISIVEEKAKQNNILAAAFTFDRIPLSICPQRQQHFITTNSERRAFMESLGINALIEYPFTEKLMNTDAGEFIEDIIIRKLRAKVVVVGTDYHFGKGRSGDVEYWGIAGLLHDLDEEQCDWQHDLSVHGPTSVEILKKEGIDDPILFGAICAHNPKSGVKARTKIQYALLAADPMSGFLKAVAQIYPDKKIASVKRKSVLKRFNEARFAKGANRDYMESIEFTGLMLEDLIDIGLEEMCAISDELGL